MATPEQKEAALKALDEAIGLAPQRYGDLCPIAYRSVGEGAFRFVDRYLQKHRRAGEIVHRKGYWQPSSRPLSPMSGE